jgi:hypothetical protein
LSAAGIANLSRLLCFLPCRIDELARAMKLRRQCAGRELQHLGIDASVGELAGRLCLGATRLNCVDGFERAEMASSLASVVFGLV